jgi:O-antigen/teichoic acid export membrane protein
MHADDSDTDAGQGDVLATSDAGPIAIRGGVIRVGGYALGLVLAMASLPFLTRHLGVDDFGSYVTVVSLITVVGLISDAGLTVVGVREFSTRSAGEQRTLMTNLVGLRVIVAVAGVVVALGFALAAGYERDLVIGTALAGLGLILLVAQQSYSVSLSAELRLGLVSGLDLLRQALTVIGTIAGILAGAGLLWFFSVPIPVGIVLALVTAYAIRGRGFVWPRFERAEWRYLMLEALPVAIASTIGSFFYRIAIIMMSVLAPAKETGYFSASFRVVEAIVMVPGLMAATAFPILARAAAEDSSRLAYALGRLFEASVVVGGWVAISVVLGAGPAIALVGGDAFEPAAEVLRVQGIALVASFLLAVWAGGLWAMRRQRALAIANAVGVAVAAGLTAALIPSSGALGAAIAMTAAELLLAACYVVSLVRGRPELMPPLAVVPKALLAIAAAGALWWLPLPELAIAVLATPVYWGVLYAVGGVPPDAIDAVRSWRRRLSPQAPRQAADPAP